MYSDFSSPSHDPLDVMCAWSGCGHVTRMDVAHAIVGTFYPSAPSMAAGITIYVCDEHLAVVSAGVAESVSMDEEGEGGGE